MPLHNHHTNPGTTPIHCHACHKGQTRWAPFDRPDGFLLGDQPLITDRLIDTLIEAHLKRKAAITLPVFEGQRGNPVIVAACLFPELERLRGDTGARALFEAQGAEIHRVMVDDPAVLIDVDCPADYIHLNKSGYPKAHCTRRKSR